MRWVVGGSGRGDDGLGLGRVAQGLDLGSQLLGRGLQVALQLAAFLGQIRRHLGVAADQVLELSSVGRFSVGETFNRIHIPARPCPGTAQKIM